MSASIRPAVRLGVTKKKGLLSSPRVKRWREAPAAAAAAAASADDDDGPEPECVLERPRLAPSSPPGREFV